MTIKGQHKQRGAALIVTLVVLVVITVIGVSALRLGLTNLAVATNAQVVTLLFQSADAGTLSMENTLQTAVAAGNVPTQIQTALVNPGAAGVVSCWTPTSATQSGACDSSANFISGRSAVVVQTSILVPKTNGSDPVTVCPDGYDTSSNLGCPYFVKITSTAVLPAMGSASTSTINGCLALAQNDGATGSPAQDCLVNANAVAATTTQEYSFGK